MESARGVGYDARTAVADVLDNSISANAKTVWIKFIWAGPASAVLILDDGHGMTAKQMDVAMTLGCRSERDEKNPRELGRFGLGLKTASLSQCARLVVASKKSNGGEAVRIWDLALVVETDDWIVEDEPDAEDRALLDVLTRLPAGTAVVWRHLDRLVGARDESDEQARLDFQHTARDVEAHIAMTFHRYLEGSRPRLRIYMQGDTEEFRVRPWDPFCTDLSATQHLPEARRSTQSGTVSLQGYVLPHKDRFDEGGYEKAGGPAGWVSQEGFYVYRNERLLVAGSWLGLGRTRRWARDEQHKLARIRLDLPASLDSAWAIDIKKSSAKPPLELRDWLTRMAERVRNEAREVFVHRGARGATASQAAFHPVWKSWPGDAPGYRVNQDHPMVTHLLQSVGDQRGKVREVLQLLESTLPLHRIWLDVAEKPEAPPSARSQLSEDIVSKLAKDLVDRIQKGEGVSRKSAVQRVRHIEPFDQFSHLLEALEH